MDGWGELAQRLDHHLQPAEAPCAEGAGGMAGAVGGCWPWGTADSPSRPARCASTPAWIRQTGVTRSSDIYFGALTAAGGRRPGWRHGLVRGAGSGRETRGEAPVE
ncbi:hypothetical protein GCM10023237_69670 [Streptomyces coeruleoprunus]